MRRHWHTSCMLSYAARSTSWTMSCVSRRLQTTSIQRSQTCAHCTAMLRSSKATAITLTASTLPAARAAHGLSVLGYYRVPMLRRSTPAASRDYPCACPRLGGLGIHACTHARAYIADAHAHAHTGLLRGGQRARDDRGRVGLMRAARAQPTRHIPRTPW